MEKIKVGVVGATGYAGAEICRLIYLHPAAELAAISSVSFEGMALSDVYPAYRGLCDLVCGTQAEVVEKSDVIFAALPHGLSQDLAAECDAQGKAFIDLGADFRLESEEEYKERIRQGNRLSELFFLYSFSPLLRRRGLHYEAVTFRLTSTFVNRQTKRKE